MGNIGQVLYFTDNVVNVEEVAVDLTSLLIQRFISI